MAWSDDIDVKKAGVGAGLGGLAGLLFNRYALGNESAGSAALASALGAALGGGGSAAYDYFAGPSVQRQTKNVDKRNEAKRLADMYLSNEGLTPKKGVKSKLTDGNADAVIADLKSGIDDSFVSRQWPWLLLPGATRATTEALGRTLVPRDSDTIAINLPNGRSTSLKVTESRSPLSWLIGTPAERRVDISKLSDEARVQLLRDVAKGRQRVNFTPNQREEILRSLQRSGLAGRQRVAQEDAAALADAIFDRRMRRYNAAVTENATRIASNRTIMRRARQAFNDAVAATELRNNVARELWEATHTTRASRYWDPFVPEEPPVFTPPRLPHTYRNLTRPTRQAITVTPRAVTAPTLRTWRKALREASVFRHRTQGISPNAFRRLRLPGLLGLANVAAIGAAGLGAIGSEVARKQRLKDLASGIVNEN